MTTKIEGKTFNKTEKEIRTKLINEKCQAILNGLLRDDDNKYCVDCDAKGPRWASWNLGILLCIRCAGIHRNLGVHISKVKSINLDAWTPEQVAHLQQMGNSQARAVYEANLPDNFRRPQTDTALESFVRAKYEQKKYIAKEWVQPPTPPPAFDIEEERRKDKERKKTRSVKHPSSTQMIEVQTNPVPRPESKPAGTSINASRVLQNGKKFDGQMTKSASADLLGLNTSGPGSPLDDVFSGFVSAPTQPSRSSDKIDSIHVDGNKKQPQQDTKSDDAADFFNQKAPEDKKLDKESILKLYESSNSGAIITPISSSQLVYQNSTNTNLLIGQQGSTTQAINGHLSSGPPGPFYNGHTPQQQLPGTQPQPQQAFFPATTNPFLANSVPSQPAVSQQLQMQMSSLQLTPGFGQSPLMAQQPQQPPLLGLTTQTTTTTSAAISAAPVFGIQPSFANAQLPGTTSGGGLINPFIQKTPSLMQPTGMDNTVDLFGTFAQAGADSSSIASQQWFTPSAATKPLQVNPVPATTNIWQ